MEKIYMEENKQKQQKRRPKMDFSVFLSFGVSIFAIISLLAVGISNVQQNGMVSYAAPTSLTGDSFVLYQADRSGGPTGKYYGYVNTGSGGDSFGVPMIFADQAHTTPVFCIEQHNSIKSGSTYTKVPNSETEMGYGLLYLLNSTYAGGKEFIKTDEDGVFPAEKVTQIWATQVAIWIYEAEMNPNDPVHQFGAGEMNIIQNVKRVAAVSDNDTSSEVMPDGISIYNQIRTVVDEAKNAQNNGTNRLSVTKASGEIGKTSDGKYFQSTLITVIGNGQLTGYDVNLSGIDGAFIVDKDQNKLNSTNIPAGTTFYVRIPADKVNEKKQTLDISVLAHFDNIVGAIYDTEATEPDKVPQKVVSVTGTKENISEGLSIDFIGAPDTSMSTAQTIYFIGLIVLLCGIGIVYANTKTVENKQ